MAIERPSKTWIWIGGAAIGALLVLYVGSLFMGNDAEKQYMTALAERGPIVRTVSATGKVNAVVTVEVGSQLSGQIMELFVDFNSEVTAGQIIARLDDSTFRARVAQSEADLASAEANVLVAKAALEEVGVQLWEAERALERKTSLRRSGVINESDLDSATGAYRSAMARIQSRKAQVTAAQAHAVQSAASLQNAMVDLDRANIRSPVTGVVIERAIDLGQTVAASFQAPKLFQIAQDLSEMQLEVNIDEADIGVIAEGQIVEFSVDAYPDDFFSGEVVQIRRAPEEIQNVVAYKVIVSVANAEGRLLPGMTANVSIVVASSLNSLLVPTSALRFTPPDMTGRNGRSNAGGSAFSIDASAEGFASALGPQRRIWKSVDGELIPISIQTGINDGMQVEITSGDVRENDRIVIGIRFPGAGSPRGNQRVGGRGIRF